MPVFKYIITDDGAILFNENTTHKQVAKGFKKIYGAGFARIKIMHRDIEVETYGSSESLKIDSVPFADKFLIEDLFNPVSKMKYYNWNVKEFYENHKKV